MSLYKYKYIYIYKYQYEYIYIYTYTKDNFPKHTHRVKFSQSKVCPPRHRWQIPAAPSSSPPSLAPLGALRYDLSRFADVTCMGTHGKSRAKAYINQLQSRMHIYIVKLKTTQGPQTKMDEHTNGLYIPTNNLYIIKLLYIYMSIIQPRH